MWIKEHYNQNTFTGLKFLIFDQKNIFKSWKCKNCTILGEKTLMKLLFILIGNASKYGGIPYHLNWAYFV